MIGKFKAYDATLKLDEKHPENSSLSIAIDPKSVDTGHEGLNEKLQNEDFFNSAKFKDITFVSKSIKRTSDNAAKVTGDMTILGVTKPLTLDVTFNKKGEFMGQVRAGFTLAGSLKRSDYGMNWGLEHIGDEVQIQIETEAVLRDVEPTKAKR